MRHYSVHVFFVTFDGTVGSLKCHEARIDVPSKLLLPRWASTVYFHISICTACISKKMSCYSFVVSCFAFVRLGMVVIECDTQGGDGKGHSKPSSNSNNKKQIKKSQQCWRIL